MDQAQNKQPYTVIALIVRSALLSRFIMKTTLLNGAIHGVVISLILYGIEMKLTKGRDIALPYRAATYRGFLLVTILVLFFKPPANVFALAGDITFGTLAALLIYSIEAAIRWVVGKLQNKKV